VDKMQREMLHDLLERKKGLEKELAEMQQEYDIKKEEYLRIIGAVDVLTVLVKEESGPTGAGIPEPPLDNEN
jgi:hypothetical protein